jgi:hypothetical protein
MSEITIVTGDDVAISSTLKRNGSTFLISPTATVSASLIKTDHSTILLGPVDQVSTASGADWSNSLVIVEFTSAQTGAITYTGEALLEVQVNDSGKTTFFAVISIIAGTIA